MRTRDKRSEFQKNLERLKRESLHAHYRKYQIMSSTGKKRGEVVQSESSASDDEGDDDDNDEPTTPFSHARRDRTTSNDQEENEEEDEEEDEEDEEEVEEDTFIIEDDDNPAVELPAEFSMGSYQDLLHHFKIVCQMFVHMAVRDVDEREAVALELQSRRHIPNH